MKNNPSGAKSLFDLDAAYDFLDFQGMNIRLNELTHEFEVSGLPAEYKRTGLIAFSHCRSILSGRLARPRERTQTTFLS